VVAVSHRPVDPDGKGFLGYLFVETNRHVASWDGLTQNEAVEAARMAWAAAKAMREELSPEFVFSAIAGRRVSHFHQHVFVRHSGTPDQVDWMDAGSWDGAPRATHGQIAALSRRLQTRMADLLGAEPR